MVILILSGF